ncbi:MAG: DUF2793 domain-containing protein [Pseudomonadota bacterium]
MSQPTSFPSTTSNFDLPLLFAGQAQKEFFVNQSLSLIDAIIGRSVIASINVPPPSPTEGENYRITAPAEGDWASHEDDIAISIGGAWNFVRARDGMALFDRAAGQFILFRSGWHIASHPTEPQGGTTIDQESRIAIVELTEALRTIGILPEI